MGTTPSFIDDAVSAVKNVSNTVADGTVGVASTVADGTVNTVNTVADGTVSAANTFADGVETAANAVKNTFTDVEDNEVIESGSATFALAASHGSLTSATIAQMDVYLKASFKLLYDDTKGKTDHTWDEAVDIMKRSDFLEPMGELVSVSASKEMSSDGLNFSGSSSDPTTAGNLRSFYRDTIGDDDIVNTSAITDEVIQQVCDMVSETGAAVTGVASVFYKKETRLRIITDLGVLRFPEVSKPYFHLYRVKVSGYRRSERTVAYEKNSAGMRVEKYSQKFQTNKTWMDAHPDMIAQASKEIDDYFALGN